MEEEKKVEVKNKIFGFRSQKGWKKALAILYYLIGILMIRNAIINLSIEDTINDTILLKVSEIINIILYFSPFLLLSDFSKGIRKKIPLLKDNTSGKTIFFFIILVVIVTGVSNNMKRIAITEEIIITENEQEYIDEEETKTEEEKKQEEEKAKKEAEEKAKKEAEEKAKAEAEKKAAEEKAKKEAEEQAKKEAEEKAKAEKEHKEYIAKQKKEGLANLKKIRKAYKSNSLSADDTYKGNRYVLYAELVSIDDSGFLDMLFNDIEVLVIYKDGNTICNAWCDFNDTERDKLKKYKKGDYILFSGVCYSAGNFSDCEIIE